MPFRQFGGRVTDSLKNRYQQSPNWSDGKFQNLQDTSMSISLKDFPKILYQQLSGRSDRTPNKPLPIKSFDHQKLMDTSEKMMYAWYGHSAIFMKLNGLNILIDPMLGPDASPIGPITTQRFSKDSLDLIDDFPEIDLLLMTHDHYDHLDFESIKKLKNKTKRYFVALGLKRHLVSWGVDSALITEFDWWEEQELGGVKVTFTPTRHFSGRGLTDRANVFGEDGLFRLQQNPSGLVEMEAMVSTFKKSESILVVLTSHLWNVGNTMSIGDKFTYFRMSQFLLPKMLLQKRLCLCTGRDLL